MFLHAWSIIPRKQGTGVITECHAYDEIPGSKVTDLSVSPVYEEIKVKQSGGCDIKGYTTCEAYGAVNKVSQVGELSDIPMRSMANNEEKMVYHFKKCSAYETPQTL